MYTNAFQHTKIEGNLFSKVEVTGLPLKHTEFKSEKFPPRRPAVSSQNAILSSIISRQIFHCSTTRIDDDTRLRQSKGPILLTSLPSNKRPVLLESF